jgi:hypothetical protein
MPSLANRASLPARLTPTPVKPIDFACKSVRFSASAVLTSGFGEPAGTATPDPARAMATRLAGSILPAAARPSIKAGVKTATSNAAPSSICFLTADDRPKVKTSLSPVAFSNCGPSSSRTAFTAVDA